MKNKLSACAIPFKCYAKNSFLEVHAWLHYSSLFPLMALVGLTQRIKKGSAKYI